MFEGNKDYEFLINSNEEYDSTSINSENSDNTSFSYNNMTFVDSLLESDDNITNNNQSYFNPNFQKIQNNPYLANAMMNNYINNIIQLQQLNQINLYMYIKNQIRKFQTQQLLMNIVKNNETKNNNNINNNIELPKKNQKKKKNTKKKLKNTNTRKKNPPKPENEIHLEKIFSGEEKRTFVRLSPIPYKCSPFDIIILIDKYLKTKKGQRIYNSIYVPLTKVIGKNKGYCFINLVNPKYVVIFYKIFNGLFFNIKNCKKPCTVVFSDKQEIDCSNDDALKRPIIFNDCIQN